MHHAQILLKPVVTEKATNLRGEGGRISFFVHLDANKIEIKKAIEKAFGVKVESVNVVVRKAREGRKNRRKAHIPGWRKAYVKLFPGESIPFFEGI